MTPERWRDIAGYAGLYQVSDMGGVRSLGRVDRFNKHWAPCVLSSWGLGGRNRAYRAVSLCKNGRVRKFQVHRLVALAFIPNPQGKPQVNHRNGDPSDNRAINLEWVTNAENNLHAYRVLGRVAGMAGKRGENCQNSHPVVVAGVFRCASYGEAAELLGVTSSAIGYAVRHGRLCTKLGVEHA